MPALLTIFLILIQAMRIVNDQKTKETAEKQKKEKELSKVKINKEDVDLIVSTLVW